MQRPSSKTIIIYLPLNFSSFSLKLENLRVHSLAKPDSDLVRVGWANLRSKMRAGVILLNTGDGLAPGTLETQVVGKGPVLRLCRSVQLPGRLFSSHTHLAPSISTHSALGGHFCLKYSFFLLVCGRSRKFENQLFLKKKKNSTSGRVQVEGSQRMLLFPFEMFGRKNLRTGKGWLAPPLAVCPDPHGPPVLTRRWCFSRQTSVHTSL